MVRNSVTGCFRDIEISFSIDVDCIRMSLRNLVTDESQVRVMYQKRSTSGLANWKQLQLTNKPVSLRLPTEVLDAYRLTFFVDDAEPISARIESILAELETLSSELPVGNLPEDIETVPDTQPVDILTQIGVRTSEEPEVIAAKQIEAIPDLSEIQHPKQPLRTRQESQQELDEQLEASQAAATPSAIQKAKPEMLSANSHSEFKISVSSLPPSVLAEQRKSQIRATHGSISPNISRKHKQKGNGFFGQFVRTLKGGKRGKTYYQESGEAIQNEFQDQLSKLERDYNEGYGLNLISWKPETLCEEETAIFLLNLMVNEIIAWQKETGRAKLETGGIVETLIEVDTLLRQTLKQTRGISTPAPTLFPNLLAENTRDLEKIRNECDAYLRRFTSKLIEQEKKHATKIEILSFRKFLTEFIRDYLFAEIAENTQGNVLPKRFNWFLELVDSEVIPIEIGKTKVSSSHHKVKDARPSECEQGTIVEIITPGLQSKDGKRVNQMAVVIEAE